MARAKREERGVTISLGDGTSVLEGLFVSGADRDAAAAVIAPPHPLFGGSMDSPVVSELAHACFSAGLASLRFNWRGVGASAGEASGEPDDAEADFSASFEHLAETLPGPLVACGYSFGAVAALRVAVREARAERLLLVAPPPSLLDAGALASFAGDLLVVTGEADALAPASQLEPLAARAPRGRFALIPQADHFYMSGLAHLGRTAAEWLGGDVR